jgi:hypothetical protein
MRLIAIVTLVALLPVAPALAQNKSAAKPKPEPLPKAEPVKAAKACADYGAGFVQVGETGTCVKIGGYVRMQGSVR